MGIGLITASGGASPFSVSVGGVTSIFGLTGAVSYSQLFTSINYIMNDANNAPSIDLNNRNLFSSNSITVNWENCFLYDHSNIISVDWTNYNLNDNTQATSVDWSNRVLKTISGGSAFNWGSGSQIGAAQTAPIIYNSTAQDMLQKVYDCLRVYGMLV